MTAELFDKLPAPPVPADVDLRNFDDMPLNVRRIRESKGMMTLPAEAAIINVVLWCASWHQVPASSLPDDEIELSQLAGFGRGFGDWRRVRALGALYGFEKCSDGRLYHRVVADVALTAWNRKLAHEYDRMVDRTRKENKRRAENRHAHLHIPPFEEWISGGRQDFSAGKAEVSTGTSSTGGGIPPENVLNGTERNRTDLTPPPPAPVDNPKPITLAAGFARFVEEDPKKKNKALAEKVWKSLNPDEALRAKIMAGLQSAKASRQWKKDDGEFIPYPANWLKARGWEDEHRVDGAALKWSEIVAMGEKHGLKQSDFAHAPAFKAAVLAREARP